MKNVLRTWLPLAVVASLLIGLVYGVLQQTVRLGFNWPQTNAVNEASYQLNKGSSIKDVIKNYTLKTPIDTTSSLFLNIYDTSGKPVAGDGILDSSLAVPPIGFLQSSDVAPSTHAATWQPRSDVRLAAVAQRVSINGSDYFLVAGRNLQQAEQLTSYMLLLCFLAWGVIMVISLLFVAVLLPKNHEKPRRPW